MTWSYKLGFLQWWGCISSEVTSQTLSLHSNITGNTTSVLLSLQARSSEHKGRRNCTNHLLDFWTGYIKQPLTVWLDWLSRTPEDPFSLLALSLSSTFDMNPTTTPWIRSIHPYKTNRKYGLEGFYFQTHPRQSYAVYNNASQVLSLGCFLSQFFVTKLAQLSPFLHKPDFRSAVFPPLVPPLPSVACPWVT